jgi:hypothetical protein
MACPYFSPIERSAQSNGKKMPPAPLGDTWSGVCHAAQGDWQPDPQTVQQLCNFGYARGRCARMPEDGPDAVRFSISHDRDGLIRIYWVMEKAHLPFAHGPLEYSHDGGSIGDAHPDACIAQQGQAYVSSYLRRKGNAVRP